MSVFRDILGRAEKLNSVYYQEQIADVAVNGVDAQYANKRKYDSADIANDLDEIFRTSEHLWKNATKSGIKKDLLFGEKGIVFGAAPPTLLESVQTTTSTTEEELSLDLDRARLETERAFLNHWVLSRPAPVLTQAPKSSRESANSVVRVGVVSQDVTSRRQLIFGDKLRKYLRSGKRKDLSQLFMEAAKEASVDGHPDGFWSETTAIVNQKLTGDRDDATSIALLVDKAVVYLGKLYVEHMNQQVERNLAVAERGGVPGTRGLVNAYLKLSVGDSHAEDGVVDGLPVWEVVFHCLRAGDVGGAKDALNRLGGFPQAACLVSSLNHLAQNDRLEADLKERLKVEWRHNEHSTKDPYKRALYSALLGKDSDLANTIEHWLWFKLIALKIDPHMTPALYSKVQKNVSIDYGDSYFLANGPGDFHLYFMALWLTGQFERAVQLLWNSGQTVDAVHVAILAFENGCLRTVADGATDTLSIDSSQPTRCSFNLARLIVAYTKQFEIQDVSRALDYFFLLKGVKTPSGGEVFEMAVSRAVYLTGKADEILGTMDETGKRLPALIDDYLEDACDVIARVANDTELSGDGPMAVRLYLLARVPTKAAILLQTELADAIKSDRDNLETIRTLAEDFAIAQKGCDASQMQSLCLLLDFCTLYTLCRTGEADRVINILQQLRTLPSDPQQVPVLASEFHRISTKVREVIPCLCLAVIECMVQAIKQTERPNDKWIKQVKALLLYSATVDYSFPHHIQSKMLSLQASVTI